MKSRLYELDTVGLDAIDEPMLVGDTAAPAAGKLMLERLRLSDANKRIGENSVHEFKNAERRLAIRLDPISKIFAKLPGNYRNAIRRLIHRARSACLFQAHRTAEFLNSHDFSLSLIEVPQSLAKSLGVFG